MVGNCWTTNGGKLRKLYYRHIANGYNRILTLEDRGSINAYARTPRFRMARSVYVTIFPHFYKGMPRCVQLARLTRFTQ